MVMVSVFRVLTGLKRGVRPQILQLACKSDVSLCSSDQLLSRFVQLPSPQIKPTLNSLGNGGISWQTIFSNLGLRSSEKARLVLEWKLEKMFQENVRDVDEFSALISLCGKLGNVQLAMYVFTAMEANRIEPTSSVFNSLIYACLSSNDVVTAISLFEIMESSEFYKSNAETYDNFISGFASLGNVDAVKKLYSAKRAAGYPATLRTFQSLIYVCVKSKNFDDADRFFEEMMSVGLRPSITILENVLEGLTKSKRFGQVEEFFKFLLDGQWEISVNMVQQVVCLYSEHGKEEEMEKLLAMLMESCRASEVLLCVHSGIIRMHALKNKLDDVEYSVGRMLKQGLSFKSSDDVEKVICCYFRQEAYERLDLFLEHIKGSYKLTRSTYDLLVSGYRRAGLFDKLEAVVKEMELAGFI